MALIKLFTLIGVSWISRYQWYVVSQVVWFLLPAVDILNRDGWALIFLSKTADSRFSSDLQGLFTWRLEAGDVNTVRLNNVSSSRLPARRIKDCQQWDLTQSNSSASWDERNIYFCMFCFQYSMFKYRNEVHYKIDALFIFPTSFSTSFLNG